MKGYLQDANGNEQELQVTKPDPTDGTYVVHMDEETWIRVVPDDRSHLVELTSQQVSDLHFAVLLRAAELVQQGRDAYDHDKWRSQQERLDNMNSYFNHANQYHELARIIERVKQGRN